MAAVDVICPGSEPECFHYLLGQVILGHRGVNLDDAHPEVVGFLVKAFREHPITFEQIVQGPLRLAGLPGDLPQGAPTLERDPTEPGRRQEPDGVIRHGEERLHEAWQQPEAFDDHTGFPRKAEEVFDDQVEAFAPKPVERLEHGCRRSVHPPLVHVHGRELAQKWAVFGCAAGGVLRHHIVCGIKTQTELSRYAACSSRLACGSGAGKSTTARRIAAQLGLRLYATDDVMSEHAARSTPEHCPFLSQFAAMDMDERWVNRPPATMLETFPWFRGEGFDLIIEDLLRLPREPCVIVEGFRLLPRLVQPLLAVSDHAVWLLPTPGFRRVALESRGSLWKIARKTSKPERALHNLLERDRMFTERLYEEANHLGVRVIEIDTTMTEDDLAEQVMEAFGL